MAVKYVRATGGSDANNGSSFALGWATLAWAYNAGNANRLVAGDTLAVCGDTGSNIFTLSATVAISVSSASLSAPVFVTGYNMSGNPWTDGGMTEITTTTNDLAGLFTLGSASDFTKYSNLLFDGGGSGKAATCILNTTPQQYVVFDTCRITNASTHGVNAYSLAGIGGTWKFFKCEIDNNGQGGPGDGIHSQAAGYGSYFVKGCKIHNNTGAGLIYGDGAYVSNTLIYNNGSDGATNTAAGTSNNASIFENNVLFNNSGDGIDLYVTAYPVSIINNIFRSNGGYGIRTNSMDIDRANMGLITNNCASNNTSGAIDINGGVLVGSGNITSDPLFMSETFGSENFTLQSGSPCRNAGYNPLDTLGY